MSSIRLFCFFSPSIGVEIQFLISGMVVLGGLGAVMLCDPMADGMKDFPERFEAHGCMSL